MLRAVVFDLGGTLLHYHDPESSEPARPFFRITRMGVMEMIKQVRALGYGNPDPAAMDEAVDRQIRESYTQTMTQMLGGSVEGPLRAALVDNGIVLNDEQWQAIRPSFYSAIDPIVTPRTGARETLSALKAAGYQLALISNTYWAADLHDRHLAEYGLIDFFDVRVYSANTTHVKPHPSIFLDTLTALGVEPYEAAYVGDRPDIDVKGAQQVGMHGILIRSPYDQTLLGEIVPDAIIDELPELIPALERLELPA